MPKNSTITGPDGSNKSDITGVDGDKQELVRKHPIDKILAGVAVFSLCLNAYLAWDKFQHKSIAQPGPQVSRITMSGLNTDIVRTLVNKGKVIAEEFPKPRFARTPAWQTAVSELETLPAIRIRQNKYRFLVVQNRTSSTYEELVVRKGAEAIAEIGVLDGNSSVLVYYVTESDIEAAEVTYRVRGARSGGAVNVPPRPRDAVELLSELSDGTLRRYGNLEDNSARLNDLINALRRSR